MSVGVGVGDVEGLGDVELVAAGATLCVGVEVAALPHPVASASASTISAMYLISCPSWCHGTKEPYGQESTPACRLGDVTVTLVTSTPTVPFPACAGMTLYQVLRELQIVLALILGACPLCRQPVTPGRLAAALIRT